MSEPIRALHIVGAMYPGGMENFIMNLYEKIDREKIQFDIAVHARKPNDYIEKINQMGGKTYELPRLTRKPIQNLVQLYRIVKDNQYKIVIRHTANALVTPQLLAARIGGAYTICHSHSEQDSQKLLHKLGRLLMGAAVSARFACSVKAGQWMYGKRNFQIIHNAINIKKFMYSAEASGKVREEFNLGQCRVYGYIANLIPSKNHMYLLKIFKEISRLDADARFFCLGDGLLRQEIETEIKRLELEDKVFLTGIRKDVENFTSCFDVLIFPSIYEGLPLTLIEAQAAGLPCLVSDTVTKDIVVTQDLVKYESIEKEPKIWAQAAVMMGNDSDRSCQYEAIANAGYDIETLAQWYENYFADILSKNKQEQ
ncbi:MAG: glycosyltransferase [Butyrivibrio sp.]|nr:glycosyltransferase [Butyrivibrio sp.]